MATQIEEDAPDVRFVEWVDHLHGYGVEMVPELPARHGFPHGLASAEQPALAN